MERARQVQGLAGRRVRRARPSEPRAGTVTPLSVRTLTGGDVGIGRDVRPSYVQVGAGARMYGFTTRGGRALPSIRTLDNMDTHVSPLRSISRYIASRLDQRKERRTRMRPSSARVGGANDLGASARRRAAVWSMPVRSSSRQTLHACRPYSPWQLLRGRGGRTSRRGLRHPPSGAVVAPDEGDERLHGAAGARNSRIRPRRAPPKPLTRRRSARRRRTPRLRLRHAGARVVRFPIAGSLPRDPGGSASSSIGPLVRYLLPVPACGIVDSARQRGVP